VFAAKDIAEQEEGELKSMFSASKNKKIVPA
jgi:hypothetical protein